MTPERWQQAKEIFGRAIQCEPTERSDFLSKVCGEDDVMRKEIETLIAAHQRTGSFIDSPAYEQAAETLASEQEFAAGQIVDHYEVLRFLGKGGMGEVYLALDKNLRRKVALKFLPSDFTKHSERLHRFELEARSASALNHPNILTIYEIGEAEGRRFIATEYIEGETLRQRVEEGPLKVADALKIAEELASALAEAHAECIVHRDLKPDNIMLRRDGAVKLLDFGLAKLTQHEDAFATESTLPLVKTGAGIVMGTFRYMSPEQARGLSVDASTDIWSLGVVLYEMVGGRAPFVGDTTSDVIVAVLEHDPPSLVSISPETPPELESIVTKALTKNREYRYQTVTEMLADLRHLRRRLDFAGELENNAAASDTSGASSQRTLSSHGNDVAAIGKVQQRISINEFLKQNKVVAGLTVLTLALALLGMYLLLSRVQSRKGGDPKVTDAGRLLKTTQLTFSSGFDRDPSISPDGNSIAYTSIKEGSSEIFVKQLTPGGGDIQLTADGKENVEAAWSPDGQLIAFSKNRRGIWIMPALGGVPKQLTEFGSNPAWSRDGKFVAFQSSAGDPQHSSSIWSVPALGGTARQITKQGKPLLGHSSPYWSPDGKRIVFVAIQPGGSSLWSISVTGDELKRISPQNFARAGDPVYSPEGEVLYFAGFSGSVSGIWQIRISQSTGDPQGEPLLIMTTSLGDFTNGLVASSDGKKIAYGLAQRRSNLYFIPISPSRNEAIAAPVPLTNDTGLTHVAPSFSPDGSKIAFSQLRAGVGTDIFLIDTDGKNLTQVTTDPATDYAPNWFPDGNRLAFLSDRKGHSAPWSVALANRKEEPLIDLGPGVDYARISPDGKRLAYNAKKDGTMKSWVVALEGGEPKALTSENGWIGYPCWSPDGQFLSVELRLGNDSYVAIMPSNGGPVTQLTFDPGLSFVHSWSPDSDKIAFAGRRNGIWNLYTVSRATKRQQQLTNYTDKNSTVRFPSWSPRGNQIVYEYIETTGNIWLLELK